MAEVPSSQRFALIGTVIGLVNKDIPLVIDNLKTLQFLPPESDTTTIVTALNDALTSSTEFGEASSLNFTKLNQNLNNFSSSGVLPFRLPPFYSLIIRTLTILEGLALSVDKEFRLIRGELDRVYVVCTLYSILYKCVCILYMHIYHTC